MHTDNFAGRLGRALGWVTQVAGIVAIGLTCAFAVTHAAPATKLKTWNKGDPLTADDLNGNFSEMRMQLSNLLEAQTTDTNGTPQRVCSGSTTPGSTDWKAKPSDQTTTDSTKCGSDFFVEIDTRACKFTVPPKYVLSLNGSSSMWVASGGSSAYPPDQSGVLVGDLTKGFRTFVSTNRSDTCSPEVLNKNKWHLQWIAIGN